MEVSLRFARRLFGTVLLSVLLFADAHSGDAAAFDLAGPNVDLHIERGGKTLPVSEVPNLRPGDRLWIHPDLPDSQSVHYEMIVAFLRGATNPPPETWFTRVETWDKHIREEGVFVTVPPDAEEALIFLAPDTGGGFATLRKAVRGKPGAFVRASQDLWQASLDRHRLDKYLAAVKDLPTGDAAEFKEHTQLLARSLSIKVDSQCFDKPTAQQVPCLTQGTDSLVLDDAHTESMVTAITSGASGDLMAQISSTPQARFGYYSPYVGAVLDVARILGSTHTAQFQYIPALAIAKRDTLNLRLNNPPSFRNPKSVIVVGLPPITSTVAPPLKAVNGKEVDCLADPKLLLAVQGAPLVFATDLAHDLTLHVQDSEKGGVDLPLQPDPARGGLIVENSALKLANFDQEVTGTIHGMWGFQSFEGPSFSLRTPHSAKLVVASKDASALIVGREDAIHLRVEDAVCVKGVSVQDEGHRVLTTTWKKTKPDEIELQIPLKDASAGLLKVDVEKFGLKQPDAIALHSYAEAGRLDAFDLHAGDVVGVLKGTRLDQVSSLEVGGIKFVPGELSRANQQDELKMAAPDGGHLSTKAGESLTAHATLNDGRTLEVKVKVDGSRPLVELRNKTVQPGADESATSLSFGNPEELPQDARLSFVLRSVSPASFPADEKIEVATQDEAFKVMLSVQDGNLALLDSKSVMAVLEPMKHLGPSAFGALKFRPVGAGAVNGDWQPLVSLVRIPQLKGVRCAGGTDKQCSLIGEKLYLINSVSTDQDFSNPVEVPDGFLSSSLPIPRPKGKTLYVKLRDNPGEVNTVALPSVTTE